MRTALVLQLLKITQMQRETGRNTSQSDQRLALRERAARARFTLSEATLRANRPALPVLVRRLACAANQLDDADENDRAYQGHENGPNVEGVLVDGWNTDQR